MLVTAALIVVLAHLALGVILWLRVRKLYSYPGLLGFPVIGNLYYFYRTLFIGSMDSLQSHMTKVAEKYGQNGLCFLWTYGFRTTVVVSSPHIVKKLIYHPNLVDKPSTMYGAYFDYFQGPFATLRSDDLWKIKRKEYNTFLKRSCVDNDFYTTFLKCSDKLINNMLASAAAADLHSLSLGLTQDISLETLFNFETNLVYHPEVTSVMIKMIEIGSIIGANSNILKAVSPILRPIMINLLIGKVAELRNSVLQTSKDSLLLNKSSPTGHPISTHIASRIEKDNGNDFILSNELHELFFTSAHTVGSTLGNAIIFLALLPDIQERAWKEQYEIFGNDKRDPNIDDLKQMHYLDRFIKEALRFLGPPYNGKLATADINVDGITIPRGTVVIYLMRYMRMDPENWKNPKAFDPDRFLEESDTLKYSFTPFGIGLRSCPGVYFATVLLKITLSKILRRLKLRPVQKDFRFEDIHYKCCIMTEVENPPLLQIEERI